MPNNESHIIRNIIIMIIIAILVWQYLIPYYDESIKIPSDYLFSENENAEYMIVVKDSTTGTEIDMRYPQSAGMTGFYTQITAWHEYNIYLRHNLDGNIIGEFTYIFNLLIVDENGTLSPLYPMGARIPGYVPLYSDSQLINSNFTVNYENDYTVLKDFKFFNSNGNLIHYANYNYTEISIYLQSPNVPKTTGIYYN